jgi:uncharacterized damage-inducible protein DinB
MQIKLSGNCTANISAYFLFIMEKTEPEFWLRGPVAGISPLLQPVAHALLEAREEVIDALINFPGKELWQKPSGLASVAFHVQHLAGVLDRLFTYARGEQLDQQQTEYFAAEGKENAAITLPVLINHFSNQIDKSLEQLRKTNENLLLETRGVGRKQIPSNVLGLLFHAAEHIQRHTGQMLVTAKIVSYKN